MILRTKEHYENRIAYLKARGETVNEKLIRKAERELRNLNK